MIEAALHHDCIHLEVPAKRPDPQTSWFCPLQWTPLQSQSCESPETKLLPTNSENNILATSLASIGIDAYRCLSMPIDAYRCLSMPEKLREFIFLTLASTFDFLQQTRLEIGGKSVLVGKTTIFVDWLICRNFLASSVAGSNINRI